MLDEVTGTAETAERAFNSKVCLNPASEYRAVKLAKGKRYRAEVWYDGKWHILGYADKRSIAYSQARRVWYSLRGDPSGGDPAEKPKPPRQRFAKQIKPEAFKGTTWGWISGIWGDLSSFPDGSYCAEFYSTDQHTFTDDEAADILTICAREFPGWVIQPSRGRIFIDRLWGDAAVLRFAELLQVPMFPKPPGYVLPDSLYIRRPENVF